MLHSNFHRARRSADQLGAGLITGAADAFQWRSGLDHRLVEAREFFGVIALGTVAGTLVVFTALDLIKAQVWSAIVDGVIAMPSMAMAAVAMVARG